MKLWIAVFVSALLAAAVALYGPPIFTPLSLSSFSFLNIGDPNLVGGVCTSILAGSVVYCVAVTALLATAIILDGLAARDTLRFVSSSGAYLLRRDWETAFSSEALKPARRRIVSQLSRTDDERLILATPFSPAAARKEFRTIYFRQLSIAQVWSVIVVLSSCGVIAALFAGEETMSALLRRILFGEAIVVAILALSWLAVIIAFDTLSSVLAEMPFLLNVSPSVVSDLAVEKGASPEQVARAIATTLRPGIEAVALKLDEISFTGLERSLATRLPQAVTEAISTALEKRIGEALPTIERAAQAMDALCQKLPVRIAEASEGAIRRVSMEQVEAIRIASDAVVAEQKATAEKMEELRCVITAGHDAQIEVLRQLGTELSELSPGLQAALQEASAQVAQERDTDSIRTTQLMQSMEAYAASLLPAIKRLESYDERVLRAMNQESETLSQLTVSLNDLSGTLEALRVQLGHAPARIPATAPERPALASSNMSGPVNQNGQGDLSGLAAELRSLLDDLDEEHPAG